MSVIVMQQPSSNEAASDSRLDQEGSEEWLLPLLAKEFIEDHDIGKCFKTVYFF